MTDTELMELIRIVLEEYDPEFAHSGDKEDTLSWMTTLVSERLASR